MSDGEEEYEIEFIVEGRIKKKRNKLIWEFRVRWKGYTPDDDTWEPLESFNGASEALEHFWQRAGDGRNLHDLSQFTAGEQFAPKGPPRKKAKHKTHQSDNDAPSEVESRPANPVEVQPTPSKRRRREADHKSEERPSKRPRDDLVAAINQQSRSFERETISPVPQPSSSKPVPSSSKKGKKKTEIRAPSAELVPDSDEEIANAMQLDRDDRSSNSAPPLPFQEAGIPEDDNNSFDQPTSPKAPAHRLRASKPLVKMFEDPNLAVPDGQLSAKSRAISKRPTSSALATLAARTSTRPRKPTASVLTADKNGLKTVRGRYRNQLAPSRVPDEGVVPERPQPVEPPKPGELLTLAGLDAEEAEALPDFLGDDEATKPADSPAHEKANGSDAIGAKNASLHLAKETLFPSSSSSLPAEAPEMTWKRSTIFGPLGLGTESNLSTEAAPGSPDTFPFPLNLDSSTSIPTLFTDVMPSGSKLVSLGNKHVSPPGKFYSPQVATSMLDVLRSGSGYGRVVIRSDASEDLKKHFSRFSKRLEGGDLFISTAGILPYAFCSSSNASLCQRLNIAPSLQVSPRQVLVATIIVENYSGYAQVAELADPTSWSQYVASL